MKSFFLKNLKPSLFSAFLAAEALSFFAFFHSWIAVASMILLGALALWLSLKSIRFGLLLLAAELVIGSQGYLFSAGVGQSTVSLRIMLWVIVMGVWLGQEIVGILRDRGRLSRYRLLHYRKPLGALAAVIVIGLIVGWANGNDPLYFFLEAKRWAYIAIIVPFLLSFSRAEDRRLLVDVCLAGALWLAVKTLLLAYFFTHGFLPFVSYLYDWSRQDLLAEITRAPSGFFRIFMQSQIFFISAIFLVAGRFFNPKRLKEEAMAKGGYAWFITVCGAALLASLSRSFWVGLACAVFACLIALIRLRPERRVFLVGSLHVIGWILASVALLFLLVRFPFPPPSASIDGSLFSDRIQLEAGAASRWSLLPVMGREILRSPLWGFGFGKTLTYVTSDPRITSTTANGSYTTYAFEWGWLDIALKFGLIGLAAYLWLLAVLLRDCWRLLAKDAPTALGLGGSLVALAIAHFFTPYLNHPLGFFYLALIMVFLQGKIADDREDNRALSKN